LKKRFAISRGIEANLIIGKLANHSIRFRERAGAIDTTIRDPSFGRNNELHDHRFTNPCLSSTRRNWKGAGIGNASDQYGL
jgi:hypothetical protein